MKFTTSQKTTFHGRYKGKVAEPGHAGQKTALLRGGEIALAQNVAVLGEFGLAFDINDLHKFVKDHLDWQHSPIAQVADNRLGKDWVYGFLERHSDIFSRKLFQKITHRCAATTEETVKQYSDNRRENLEGVPPSNIINYETTNNIDEPKSKGMIFKRGLKHAEQIINTAKATTSIMFAITRNGDVLAPYVVYKSEQLQDTWMVGGPIVLTITELNLAGLTTIYS